MIARHEMTHCSHTQESLRTPSYWLQWHLWTKRRTATSSGRAPLPARCLCERPHACPLQFWSSHARTWTDRESKRSLFFNWIVFYVSLASSICIIYNSKFSLLSMQIPPLHCHRLPLCFCLSALLWVCRIFSVSSIFLKSLLTRWPLPSPGPSLWSRQRGPLWSQGDHRCNSNSLRES